MRQFISGSEPAYTALENRARTACIRFQGEDMPPGCSPHVADVGFEVDRATGAAKLYVTTGINYRGNDPAVREWLTAGVKQFRSFTNLRRWIQETLGRAFNGMAANGTEPNAAETRDRAAPITDMSAIHGAIRDLYRPLYLDEDKLFARLRERVLGQDAALKGLAAVMQRHCARRSPSRPAVLFAVGPSGVGKTRTADVLAQVLREFDSQNNGYQFLRLDMTEYQEAHRVSQLIGAPQGYVGHGEGSQLIDALRANPKTIVLFDEIEKAHPAILRVLMNAMDAGRLSTASHAGSGREVDCRHAIFMFTSNLDAKSILDELESREAFGERSIEDEVCRRRLHAAGIPPEIIGRIGRFLVYRPLSPDTRAEIMAMAIAEVGQEYGLNVAYVEPSVIIDLMQKTRSTAFGVRPERYMIDDCLGGVFATAAETNVSGPVRVAGPPFECAAHELTEHAAEVPHESGDDEGTEPRDTGGD